MHKKATEHDGLYWLWRLTKHFFPQVHIYVEDVQKTINNATVDDFDGDFQLYLDSMIASYEIILRAGSVYPSGLRYVFHQAQKTDIPSFNDKRKCNASAIKDVAHCQKVPSC